MKIRLTFPEELIRILGISRELLFASPEAPLPLVLAAMKATGIPHTT
jgi:hypothetical protein